jgi:luciferase family oxidoreductase group 1
MLNVPLSLLDLASVGPGESIAESFRGSVEMAQLAETAGYRRVWYAEHHSIASIASAATSVLIAHVAAHTQTIRLGAGGIMLPNHSPLTIAEQFGTLAELHPGRIDLGVGRAPGGDQHTLYALRRDPGAADRFAGDVAELQGLLGDESPIPGVRAIPGHGTHVPLYVLGSSLFGARLAARRGLPYAFASHFAPALLRQATDAYRECFEPSSVLQAPYLLLGINVIAAETDEQAESDLQLTRRLVIRNLAGRGGQSLGDVPDRVLFALPHAALVEQMFTYSAVGRPERVAAALEEFQEATGADELITVHHGPRVASRLRSVRLLALAAGRRGELA